MERRERQALRNKMKSDEHIEIYRGISEGIGMKTYLHRPKDFAKTLKLRFRVGDLDCQREERGVPVTGRRRRK